MEQHRINAGPLTVTIKASGAEPTSIAHATAGEVLWQAGPAWPRHAPVLFPIVGALAHDEYRHGARSFKLGRHGFARDLDFAWTDVASDACTLTLVDDDRTFALFPFRFRLDIRYSFAADTLAVAHTVHNPGIETLPASLGAHPAFRWPLADGVPKEAHVLTFAHEEPEPIRRLAGALLDPTPFPTPIRGRELTLDPSLFDADAIILDRPRSTSVTYSASGTPRLHFSWTGFEQLGLWSNLGGDFVCIEPWYGYASPVEFDGDFAEKPGLMHLPPGASMDFEWRVRIAEPGG